MITLSEQDVQRNLRAVAHAIAQQELERLAVTPETIADLQVSRSATNSPSNRPRLISAALR